LNWILFRGKKKMAVTGTTMFSISKARWTLAMIKTW
jgi:hypothetical protein